MKTFYKYLFTLILGSFCAVGSAQFIDEIMDTTAVQNELYQYQVEGHGFPPIIYSLINKPSGMTISATGLISWTPNTTSQGGLATVQIVDGSSAIRTRDFYLYVSDAVTCPSSMKGYWKFDEATGPYIGGATGYDATVVTSGVAASVIGKINNAIQLTPVSALTPMLDVNYKSNFDVVRNDSFSVALWFKKGAASIANESLIGRMFDNGFWWLGLSGDEGGTNYGKITFQFDDYMTPTPGDDNARYPTVKQATIASLNEWHHVVAVFIGAESGSNCTMNLYVDNVLVATKSVNLATTAYEGTQKLNIGYLNYDPANHVLPFTGNLDNVAYYTKALTSQEVTVLYNDGNNGISNCKPGNYIPVIRSTPSLTPTQGVAYSYKPIMDDIDGDPLTLTFNADSIPSWMTYNQTTKTFSGTPSNSDVKSNVKFSIKVSDTKVDIYQRKYLTVNNVNDAPTITSTAVTTADEDSPYTYTVTYQDIDLSVLSANEQVTLTAQKPAWLNFNASTGVLSGTPTNNDAGHYKNDTVYQIKITATDKAGAFVDQIFNLTVENINDLPVFHGPVTPLSVLEDKSLTITPQQLNVTDADDVYPDDFILTVTGGTNYTVVGNTITPVANFHGNLQVNIKLDDKNGGVIDKIVDVTVTSVNDRPKITSPVVPVTISEGEVYQYVINATDDDGTTPTKSVIKKPGWLVYTPATGSFAGIPKFEDVGKDTVTFRVTDGIINVDTTFYITIEKINRKPVFQSTPVVSVSQDQLYTYTPAATDQDGDVLVYSAVTIPSWLTFDASTRELKGTPTGVDLGLGTPKNFNVTIRVTDTKEPVDQNFTITVHNTNDAPVITGQNDTLSFLAAENFAITVDKLKVTDWDNLLTDLTVEVQPGANYTAVGNVINVTTHRGRLEVNVKAKDLALYSETYKYIVTVEGGTGISNLKATKDLVSKVYPVPASASVTFELNAKTPVQLQITNSEGKLIKNDKLDMDTTTYEFNVSNLPQGVYYYKAISSNAYQTGKIVVVK